MNQQMKPSTLAYRFAPKPELFWFIAIAAVTVLAQALVEFDPEKVTDWQAWIIALLAALGRAVGGAVLTYLTKHGLIYDDTQNVGEVGEV